jgi:hypothetical protein
LKQLRTLYGEPYSEEELILYLSTIHHNLLISIKILISQAKILKILSKIESQISVEIIENYSGNISFLTPEIMKSIQVLWSDPIIKTVWNLKFEFSINENIGFLFDKCDKFATPGYMPNMTDIFHCSLATTGYIFEYIDLI